MPEKQPTKTEKQPLRHEPFDYQDMLMNAPIGVFSSTPDGRFIYANSALAEMFGYDSPQELTALIGNIGEQLYVDPGDREKIKRLLEKHDEVLNFESRYIRKNGSMFWASYNVRAVRNEKGDIDHYQGFFSDITERKQERESLLRTQFAMDRAPDSILWIDDKGRIVYANDSACASMGYERRELLEMKVFDIDPNFAQERYEDFKEKMRRLGSMSFESRHCTKNGRIFPVEVNTKYFQFDDRFLVCGFDRDITERKRAEETLRESEEKYRSLVEGLNEALFRMTIPDGIYVYISQAAIHVFGYSAEEILANPLLIRMAIHPDFNDFFEETFEKLVTGEVPPTFEYKIVDSQGQERWILQSNKGIFNDQGKIVALEGLCRDITKRKRSEEELRESEGVLRSLLEATPAGVALLKDRVFKKVNKALCRITGYTEDEMMGMITRILYPNEEEFERIGKELYEMMKRDGLGVKDAVLKRKDSELIDVVLSLSPFNPDDISAGVCATVLDITERRREEKEREKLKEQLDRAQRLESIGTLAGGVAHDFNNLLMGIQGNAALMMLDLDPSDPNYERLMHIEEQVRSGADLTRQLLGFAQGGRYAIKPMNMNDIIEKTATMFGRTKKQITIHRKYGKDLWAAEVDGTQMGQVFMNLFVNAWQAMPGGGDIFLETENLLLNDAQAHSLSVSEGKYIKITITDRGTGMDARTLERIFDPFFTTKGMGRGTGLGLATVYGVIKGHGGVINVMSQPGKGTTFSIYLPATEKSVISETTSETEVLRGTETILLVDDEITVLDVTRRMLQALGYRVHCAGTGREAIAVCHEKKNEIDLVILDIIMPGMSGSETFDGIRKINPGQRVLLSSGYSVNDQAKELLEKGCNGFLQKPFQLKELARELRTILDVKETPL